MGNSHDHFKGKGALAHVVEAQARGIIAASEIHGTEIPGSLSAAFDSARDVSVFSCILILFGQLHFLPKNNLFFEIILLVVGLLIWKTGRSAWLAWSRLERLHDLLKEEHWEIEHNRDQEREELKILYHAKGFEGELLEQVLDVLMADNDRLLKVMIEEELGLSLEVHEHPLMQAIGAGLGSIIAGSFILFGYLVWPFAGAYIAGGVVIAVSGYLSGVYQNIHLVSAVVWNLALGSLSVGSVYFLYNFVKSLGWVS